MNHTSFARVTEQGRERGRRAQEIAVSLVSGQAAEMAADEALPRRWCRHDSARPGRLLLPLRLLRGPAAAVGGHELLDPRQAGGAEGRRRSGRRSPNLQSASASAGPFRETSTPSFWTDPSRTSQGSRLRCPVHGAIERAGWTDSGHQALQGSRAPEAPNRLVDDRGLSGLRGARLHTRAGRRRQRSATIGAVAGNGNYSVDSDGASGRWNLHQTGSRASVSSPPGSREDDHSRRPTLATPNNGSTSQGRQARSRPTRSLMSSLCG